MKYFFYLDMISSLMIMAQGWILSLYSDFTTSVQVVNVAMAFYHAFDMTVRLYMCGSLIHFLNDPRGPSYYLKNRCSLWLSALGLTAAIAFILGEWVDWADDIDNAWVRILQAGTLMPMWRILVIHQAFRDLTVAFLTGLTVVRKICLLLGLVFYTYCIVAWTAFHGIDVEHSTVFSSVANFSSLFDTALISDRLQLLHAIATLTICCLSH